jgi:hypothetical protein
VVNASGDSTARAAAGATTNARSHSPEDQFSTAWGKGSTSATEYRKI